MRLSIDIPKYLYIGKSSQRAKSSLANISSLLSNVDTRKKKIKFIKKKTSIAYLAKLKMFGTQRFLDLLFGLRLRLHGRPKSVQNTFERELFHFHTNINLYARKFRN